MKHNIFFHKRFFSLIVLFLFFFQAYSQKIHYYSDTTKEISTASSAFVFQSDIYSYFLCNDALGYSDKISPILKVDTAGKLIWTAYPLNFINSFDLRINFDNAIIDKSENIYTLFHEIFNTGVNLKLAKINGRTGSYDWITDSGNYGGYRLPYIGDYLQNYIITAFTSDGIFVTLMLFDKINGKQSGKILLRCPSEGRNFAVCSDNEGAIYLANSDSCYKYRSFDNPTLDWQVRTGVNSQKFYKIEKIIRENDCLLLFGNTGTPDAGLLSCIDLKSNSFKWKYQTASNVSYADYKIKDTSLYITWRNSTFGSIATKCYISKLNLLSGDINWQFNIPFRPDPFISSFQQSMITMEIDSNEYLYLSGYAPPEGFDQVTWAFMKIDGKNGAVLKKNYILNCPLIYNPPYNIKGKLIGNKYFVGGSSKYQAAYIALDTSSFDTSNFRLLNYKIQQPSTVIGVKNISNNKKVIIKEIGKTLKAEVALPFLINKWNINLSDTKYPYEGITTFGVNNLNNIIEVPYFQSVFSFGPEFFRPTAKDTFHYSTIDSSGKLLSHTKSPYDTSRKIVPIYYFHDSLNNFWRGNLSKKEIFASSVNYSSIGGSFAERPYNLINPLFHFPYQKDTILFFIEPKSSYSSKPALLKSWYPYHSSECKFFYWPSLKIKLFNSIERDSNNNFYVLAKDSLQNDLLFKYRYIDSTILWSVKSDSTMVTIKGYESDGFFYALSKQLYDIKIKKYDGTNGNVLWSKKIDVPTDHILTICDFALSKQRQKITIAGYLTDTFISTQSKAYVKTIDFSGNDIITKIFEGYKSWQNKATSINIGQDGQTLVSGQVTDSINGYAGFIYEVDETTLQYPLETPVIKKTETYYCSQNLQEKLKLLNPPLLPFEIYITFDNATNLPYNRYDSSFTIPLNNSGNHSITISYNYSGQSIQQTFQITIRNTPEKGEIPFISGNLLTAPATGDSYTWFLNSTILNGFTNKSLTITQNGYYTYSYMQNGCESVQSPPLNVISTGINSNFTNNQHVIFFPNPTNGITLISGLNKNHKYEAEISDISGKKRSNILLTLQNNSYSIDLSKFPNSIYFIKIIDNTTNQVIIKTKLQLLK